jgi:hypothetical protein
MYLILKGWSSKKELRQTAIHKFSVTKWWMIKDFKIIPEV